LTALDTILLNALGGDVGSLASPILLNMTPLTFYPIVTCGALGNGYITGITGDNTIHCLPSNLPIDITFNGVSTGCKALTPCPPPPICPICPVCPTCPVCPGPSPKPVLPFQGFVAIRAFVPGIYDLFDFSLASDFFFLEDRAVGCEYGTSFAVYNRLREPDAKCTYDRLWIRYTK
jgi:hypothetical protein